MSDLTASEESPLDKAIRDVLSELDVLTADSKEYAAATDQLVKLHKLKQDEEKLDLESRTAGAKYTLELRQQDHQEALDSKPKRVSPDTLAAVAGNLLGIIVIVGYENKHVITSKALSFLKALR
jgi:hypothetical protein